MFAFCGKLNGPEHKDHTKLVIASASEAILKATLAFSARHVKDCHGPLGLAMTCAKVFNRA